jgi:hypothetical protein
MAAFSPFVMALLVFAQLPPGFAMRGFVQVDEYNQAVTHRTPRFQNLRPGFGPAVVKLKEHDRLAQDMANRPPAWG